MKFRSTWILIIVLGIVAAYFFLVEEPRRETNLQRIGESKNVLPYGREDIEKIILINPVKERIVMERDGEEWTIVQPVRTKGSNPTIDAVLMQIVPGLKIETFPGVTNLGDFGFDDPFATVVLFARGRKNPDTIYVGDKTPTSARCYVRLGSSHDILITHELTHNVVNKSLYHLRDKNLFKIGAGEIDRLDIQNGPVRISLIKRDGEWRFDESKRRADGMTVAQYLNALASAIIYGFVLEDLTDLEQYGLKNPDRKLVIGAAENEFTLSFGRTEERMVYAVRSGIDKVLRLRDDLLSLFSMDDTALRAREFAFFERDDVKGISIDIAGTVITAADRGNGWRIAGPDSIPLVPLEVQRLLGTLRGIRFEELFDATHAPPEIEDGAASISITLEDANGGTIDRMMLATSTAGYEFGSSTSAMTIGRLRGGTVTRIGQLIDRLRG